MTVAAHGASSAGSEAVQRATILVVDDHRPNLVALEAVLSPLQQPLQLASSGTEALRWLEEGDFAVALLDVQMPGLSGLDVASRLRDRANGTPIIFLTATHEDTEIRADGYDRGAVDFISKPFDANVLRAKVRIFIQLHAQRRELERLAGLYDAQRVTARKRVQTLAEVSARLSRLLSADEVARVVITEAHDALRASASVAYVESEDGSELVLLAGRGIEADWLPRLQRLPLDALLPLTAAVRSGQPVWIESREALVRLFPSLESTKATQAVAALPLDVGNRSIGAVAFSFDRPASWDTAEQEFLLTLAAQFAAALERSRLLKAERESHEEAQRLIAQLDKSNKELDQFAYVASHDLKAPLRGITNLSQWLEEDLGDAITEGGRKQLDLLRNRVQRMEGLINGILDYSRAGRVRARPEPVAVAELLSDVVEMSATSPSWHIEIGPGMPSIRTERVPLQQIFLNLVGNALKHAKRSDPHVRIGVVDQGEWFEFFVSDNGPGVAPEYHERIWAIFQTLEPRDAVEGTGIGLSIVKKIVESKGGRTWVESEPGAGATFRFTWPKAEREVVTSA